MWVCSCCYGGKGVAPLSLMIDTIFIVCIPVDAILPRCALVLSSVKSCALLLSQCALVLSSCQVTCSLSSQADACFSMRGAHVYHTYHGAIKTCGAHCKSSSIILRAHTIWRAALYRVLVRGLTLES